jgi:hypothetical protein
MRVDRGGTPICRAREIELPLARASIEIERGLSAV